MEAFNVEHYVRRGKTIVLTLRADQEEAGRQWGDHDTILLLDLMEQNIDEFQNQTRRKKDIWIDISKDICTQNYFWGPEDCRKKWSNMIRTFKSIFESRTDQVSPKRIRWNFYEQMLKLFTLPSGSFLPESGPIMTILNGLQLESTDEHGGSIWKVIGTSATDSNAMNSSLLLPSGSIGHRSKINEQNLVGPEQEILDSQIQMENYIATEEIQDADAYTSEEIADVEVTSNQVLAETPEEVEMDGTHTVPDFPLEIEHEQVFRFQPSQRQSSKTIDDTSSYVKPSKIRKRNTKGTHSGGTEIEESLTEQFLSIAKEQNERVLALMTKFHEETIHAMRERNNILRDLSDALKQDLSS